MSFALGIARELAALASSAPRRWPGAATTSGRGERFLVNLSAGIGDALMALPMIRVLRAARPAAHIGLLATEVNATLLEAEPGIDAVIRWPPIPRAPDLLAMARQVADGRFDAVLCTLPSDLVSTALALRLAGVPLRVKHRLVGVERARDWQFCFTDLVEPQPTEHKVFENLRLLEPAGVATGTQSIADLVPLLRLTLAPAEIARAQTRLPRIAGRHRIGFHPGCKPGWEFKRWNPEHFAALADRLAVEQGAEIVWFGGADEATDVGGIMRRMRSASTSMAGELGIRDTAALIASCAAFVSNDSGPMHVATAVGVPTIGLFSDANPRTQPSRTGPFGPAHTVIGRSDLQAITPAEVATEVARLLSR